MYSLIKFHILIVLLLIQFAMWGQTFPNWSLNTVQKSRFIENKGQFVNNSNSNKSRLIYGVEGWFSFYLTNKGFQYKIRHAEDMSWNKRVILEHEERKQFKGGKQALIEEKKREGNFSRKEIKEVHAQMEWVGANENCEIVGVEEVLEYWVYSDTHNKRSILAKGFKKVLYKNLYPNIDVEYEIDEHGGRYKYSLVLHPGADLTMVRMRYSGEITLKINKQGELLMTCKGHEIKENLPLTFYEDNKEEIKSSFVLNGNEVSFSLANYDKSRKVIVDPWVQTGFPNNYTSSQIEKDASGNIYVYSFLGDQALGSVTVQNVSKISSAGVLQWTSIVGNLNNWFDRYTGDLEVDASGNVYLSNSFSATVPPVTQVIKLNNNGAMIWSSDVSSSFYEGSLLSFNCDYSSLVLSGAGVCCNNAGVGTVNQNTGAVSTVYSDNMFAGDVRSSVFGKNGYYYALTASKLNRGCLIILDGNNSFNFISRVFLDQDVPEVTTAISYNAVAASCKYLYTFLGEVLEQRDLSTGVLLNKVKAIPNGAFMSSMGIDVDDCGNVYLGTTNGVLVYDESLNLLNTFSTSDKVVDVLVDNKNGFVYACGGTAGIPNGTGVVAQFSIQTICVKDTLLITKNIPACGLASATVTAKFCSPPYTYKWSDGQSTQTANNLSTGKYKVIVTGSGMCVEKDSAEVDIAVTICCPDTTLLFADTLCYGEDLNLNSLKTNHTSTGSWQITQTPVGTHPAILNGNRFNAFKNGDAGDYILEYTINGGPYPNCAESNTRVITIRQKDSVEIVRPIGPFCLPHAVVQLFLQSPVNGVWSGNGVSSFGMFSPNTAGAGTSVITFTKNTHCLVKDTIHISLYDKKQADIITPDTTVCSNSTSFNLRLSSTSNLGGVWYENSNVVTSLFNLNSSSVGNHKIYYVVQGFNQTCSASDSVEVTILQSADASIVPPIKVDFCEDEASITLSPVHLPATGVWWSIPAGGVSNMGVYDPQSAVVGKTKVYYGMSQTCGDTSYVELTNHAVPVFSLGNDLVLCDGEKTQIGTLVASDHYSWIPNTYSSKQIEVSATGEYILRLRNLPSCDYFDTISVEVKPVIKVNLGNDTVLCFEKISSGYLELKANYSGAKYLWSSGDTSASILATKEGVYTVTAYYEGGYCKTTDDIYINDNCEYTIYFPNAFTPNGDGLNDKFPLPNHNLKGYHLMIFDRWGELIFESYNSSHQWDGTYKGNKVQEDVYVWKCIYQYENEMNAVKSETMIGRVTVVR